MEWLNWRQKEKGRQGSETEKETDLLDSEIGKLVRVLFMISSFVFLYIFVFCHIIPFYQFSCYILSPVLNNILHGPKHQYIFFFLISTRFSVYFLFHIFFRNLTFSIYNFQFFFSSSGYSFFFFATFKRIFYYSSFSWSSKPDRNITTNVVQIPMKGSCYLS